MKKKQTEFPRFTEQNQTNHTRDRKLRNRTNNDNNDFYQSGLVHFQGTQDCSCICKIDPLVLLQKALTSHVWLLVEHSSISKKEVLNLFL